MLRTSIAAFLLSLGLLGCQAEATSPTVDATPVAPTKVEATKPGKKSKKSSKKQDIRKLLVVTGSAEIGIQSLKAMISQFRATMPNVPAEFWDEFMKEVSADDLIDLIVPIYDKHYTHKEIKQLIAFYETPIGKKSVKVMPQIVRESQVAGQKWGLELGQKVQKKLQKSGHAK